MKVRSRGIHSVMPSQGEQMGPRRGVWDPRETASRAVREDVSRAQGMFMRQACVDLSQLVVCAGGHSESPPSPHTAGAL